MPKFRYQVMSTLYVFHIPQNCRLRPKKSARFRPCRHSYPGRANVLLQRLTNVCTTSSKSRPRLAQMSSASPCDTGVWKYSYMAWKMSPAVTGLPRTKMGPHRSLAAPTSQTIWTASTGGYVAWSANLLTSEEIVQREDRRLASCGDCVMSHRTCLTAALHGFGMIQGHSMKGQTIAALAGTATGAGGQAPNVQFAGIVPGRGHPPVSLTAPFGSRGVAGTVLILLKTVGVQNAEGDVAGCGNG